ncbi:hypothetical protein A4X06_0g3618 [Tilletia controversa]|uniref:Uncharacterized protein n=1 Tax=Tilletia controversa TaxID=13291 RepID=A0A8X7SXZ7_9BASI|nr:hypothetical protein A4X06_0g3618 [Tilletia controversa]
MLSDRRWCDAQVPFEPSQQVRATAHPPSSPTLPIWHAPDNDARTTSAHSPTPPVSSPLAFIQEEDGRLRPDANESALPFFAALSDTSAAETLAAIASSTTAAWLAPAPSTPAATTSTPLPAAAPSKPATKTTTPPAAAPATPTTTTKTTTPPAAAPATPATTTTTPLPTLSPSTPARTQSVSAYPSSDWPLKQELRGSQAHYYRGPLAPAKVIGLLSTSISKNGRLSLTGTRAGYLSYFHYLGPESVPSTRKRTGNNRRHTELWQCRVCHEELHIPQDQVSNLGIHLYGQRSRPGRGCLATHEHDPAENIPPPPRNATGSIIRLQAGKNAAAPTRTTRS